MQQNCQIEPLTRVNFTVKSFVILTCAVDVPDPCENWLSTPGPKPITLESCDKIRLPIISALCLKVYLSIKPAGLRCVLLFL